MRTKDLDKQQRIKQAIVQLFLRDGINGISMAKIAQEAGVSPATIYIYYSNKEEMLIEVYREYSHQSYYYLMQQMQPKMSGAELIECIVRGIYTYTVEHEEVFSFLEQCSRSPSLSETVSERECCCDVFDLIHRYQELGIIRRYTDASLYAVLFSPVKFLAQNRRMLQGDVSRQLDELVQMMQRLLLD